MSNVITAKELRELLSYAPKPFPAIENLIKDASDNYELNLFDRNACIASKLWVDLDVLLKANEMLECIPEKLLPYLRISKELPDIVDTVSCSEELEHLNDCTDEDWETIETALDHEFCKRYGETYPVTIKITYPNNTIDYVSGNCNELTHEIISDEVSELLTNIQKVKADRSKYKFTVCKHEKEYVCVLKEDIVSKEKYLLSAYTRQEIEKLYWID